MAQSNDSAETVDTIFDEVFRPLQEPLEQHEQDHPPHHRETLSFMVFVRLLVYFFTKGCESGRLLLIDDHSGLDGDSRSGDPSALLRAGLGAADVRGRFGTGAYCSTNGCGESWRPILAHAE